MDLMQKPLKHVRHYDDNTDVPMAREESKLRLKSTLEDVIRKYSKDFTDVGDEIDLESGELVVDNGHLRKMQHEADAASVQSSLRTNRANDQDEDSEDELLSPSCSVRPAVPLRRPSSTSKPDHQIAAASVAVSGQADEAVSPDSLAQTRAPLQTISQSKQWDPNDPAMVRVLAESIARELAKALGTPAVNGQNPGLVHNDSVGLTETFNSWSAPPLPPRPSYLLEASPSQKPASTPLRDPSILPQYHRRRSASTQGTRNTATNSSGPPFGSIWAETSTPEDKTAPKKSTWTKDELAIAADLRRKGYTAEQIALHMPNRTIRSVANKLTSLDMKRVRAESLSNAIALDGVIAQDEAGQKHNKAHWESEHRQRFKKLMDKGYRWEEIVPHFPERTAKAVRQRFYDTKRHNVRHSWHAATGKARDLDESNSVTVPTRVLSRRNTASDTLPWSLEETSLLSEIVITQGLHWRDAIQALPCRSSKSLKEKARVLSLQHEQAEAQAEATTVTTLEHASMTSIARQPPRAAEPRSRDQDICLNNPLRGATQDSAEVPERLLSPDTALRARPLINPEHSVIAQHVSNTEPSQWFRAGHKQLRWTQAEEALLIDLVDKKNLCWSAVSTVFPHRTLPSLRIKVYNLSSERRGRASRANSSRYERVVPDSHSARKRPQINAHIEKRGRKRKRASSTTDNISTESRTSFVNSQGNVTESLKQGLSKAEKSCTKHVPDLSTMRSFKAFSSGIEDNGAAENPVTASKKSRRTQPELLTDVAATTAPRSPCKQLNGKVTRAASTRSLRTQHEATIEPQLPASGTIDPSDSTSSPYDRDRVVNESPTAAKAGRKKQNRSRMTVLHASQQAGFAQRPTIRGLSSLGSRTFDSLDDGSEDELA